MMAEWDIATQVKSPSAQDVVAPLAAYTNMQLAGERSDQLRNQLAAASKFQALRDQGKSTSEAIQGSGLAAWSPAAAQHLLSAELQGNQLGAYAKYAQSGNPVDLRAAGPEVYNKGITAENAQQQNQIAINNTIGNIATGFLQNPSERGRAQAVAQLKGIGVDDLTLHNLASLPLDQAVMAARQYAGAGEKSVASSGLEELNKGTSRAQTAGAEAYNKAAGEGLGKAATLVEKVAPGEGVYMAPAAQAAASAGTMPGVPQMSGKAAAPQVSPFFARAASMADGFSPAGLARTAQIESAGNPKATNASGAAGLMQFLPATWKQYGQGSPFDAQSAAEAAQRYAADNKRLLTNALGRAPTDAELYLAHQQGGGGAVKLLSNPNAPAASVVGLKAVIANGGRPDMTAGQFAQMWVDKFNRPGATPHFDLTGRRPGGPPVALPPSMGGSTPMEAPAMGPGAVAPIVAPPAAQNAATPGLPSPPSAAPVVPAPSAGSLPAQPPIGGQPPVQQPSPGVTAPATGLPADRAAQPLTAVIPGMTVAQRAEQEHFGAELGKLPQQYAEEASAAAQLNATVDQMKTVAEGWRHGLWANVDQSARLTGQALANMAGIKTTAFDQPIANYEEFNKKAGELARQATKEASSRAGVMELQMVSKSLPSPEMSSRGFEQVASTYQGLADYKIAKQQAAQAWAQTHSGSLQGFEPEWNKNITPTAFWLHRMPEDDLRTVAAEMGKSAEGRATLQSLMRQMSWANQTGLFAR